MILCALQSCSGAWTKDDEIFTQTYTEILIVREQFAGDSAKANARFQEVLREHGFTETTFRQRFSELTSKPEKLRQILDTARNRARRIGEAEGEKERKLQEQKLQEQKLQEQKAQEQKLQEKKTEAKTGEVPKPQQSRGVPTKEQAAKEQIK